MKQFKIIIFLVIIINNPFLIFAQSIEQRQLDMAKTYEQSGDLESASRLYLELSSKHPENLSYLDSWVKIIKQQNKYTDYLDYLKDLVQKNQNFRVYIYLGEAYWLKGMPNEANEAWNTAKSKITNQDDFILLTQSMLDLKQFAKARDLLLEIRKKYNNENIFNDELSKIYLLLGDNVNAINEILKNLKITGAIGKAEGRLYALMLNDEGKEIVKNALESGLETGDALYKVRLMQVIIWYYRTINNFDKALEYTKELDNITNSNYTEVLRFANQSLADNQYDIALKAFLYIINQNNFLKTSNVLPSAMYGFARTLEQKNLTKNKISQNEIEEIKKIYLKIINDFPNSNQQYDGYYRLALIASKYENDDKKAIDYLKKISKKYGITPLYYNSQSKLAEFFLKSDDFQSAQNVYSDFIKSIPSNMIQNYQDYIDNFNFSIAQLFYYQGKFDSTNVYLSKIKLNENSNIINDYLEFRSFLNENINLNKALEIYAKAEFEEIKYDFTKSIELYKEAAKFGAGSGLEEKAMLNIARLYFEEKKYEESITQYNEILDKFPNSISRDLIYLNIGKSFAAEQKYDEAISSLTKILIEFPKSIYYDDARQLIRDLRSQKEKVDKS